MSIKSEELPLVFDRLNEASQKAHRATPVVMLCMTLPPQAGEEKQRLFVMS